LIYKFLLTKIASETDAAANAYYTATEIIHQVLSHSFNKSEACLQKQIPYPTKLNIFIVNKNLSRCAIEIVALQSRWTTDKLLVANIFARHTTVQIFVTVGYYGSVIVIN
jgi:hypothetical protein